MWPTAASQFPQQFRSIRDPVCNRDPASIGTIHLNPRPVSGAQLVYGTRLLYTHTHTLSEVLRYTSVSIWMRVRNNVM